ncbi:hypothetical protein mRhiFer1_008348 [Rhinolophus ferrumequinum]|uniref:Uncharacterized protein n=1 Tax=Rhinolophus ferrumequinum TaxID=59479 RepID=A0A7J7VDU4_RHIFE|nr:hypothetical protein mRhiFer1_008348 [Rhinolophus ferrumequinum]
MTPKTRLRAYKSLWALNKLIHVEFLAHAWHRSGSSYHCEFHHYHDSALSLLHRTQPSKKVALLLLSKKWRLLTPNIHQSQDQGAARSMWSSDRQYLTQAAGRGVHPSHSYTALGSVETRRCQTQRSAGWHRLNAKPAHISNPPITLLSNMAKKQERRRQWWQ